MTKGDGAIVLPGQGPLVLVGCGNMGRAMLAGWIDRGIDLARVLVQDPEPTATTLELLAKHGIRQVANLASERPAGPPAMLLMAVKPQVMTDVFAACVPVIGPETVVLSVAAGRTIAGFAAAAPDGTAIVRTIPNTPAAIGRGMTVCCANAHVTAVQREMCTALLSAIGQVGWVDDEGLIDAATAVSGSGPAYVFLLAECLAAAGVKAGLPAELSMQLAKVTIDGAGALMIGVDDAPDQLRRNVTSPKGTTQAALDVFMTNDALAELVERAVAAAHARSRELAG